MNFQSICYQRETSFKPFNNLSYLNEPMNLNPFENCGLYNILSLPSSIYSKAYHSLYQQNHHLEQKQSIDMENELNTPKKEEFQLIVKDEVPFSLTSHSQFSSHSRNASLSQFRIELDNMIGFLLFNMQKGDGTSILNIRMNYSQNSLLLHVYDNLVRKYSSMKKTKEDLIRLILRKAIKTIKAWTMKKAKVSRKKAGVLFCQKYLLMDVTKLQESGIDIKTEEEIIEFAMPYSKKSKNKTMNMSFVLEIFQTNAFIEAYQHFLPQLDDIIQGDSLKRKEKFLSFVLKCAQTNNLAKIETFSRLPWLDVWIQDCKNLAIGIIPGRTEILTNIYKRQKIDS